MNMTKKNDPNSELDDTTQSTVDPNSVDNSSNPNSSNTNNQTTDEIKKDDTNVEKKVYHF